ncbi:MAG: hypothetical protein QOJ16_4026 [Acidobacteriota bacterium]|nr:hypothetical protein [Acidobacteriota bacterium]
MSEPTTGSTATPSTTFRSIPVWLRVGEGATEIIYRTHGGGTGRASWTPAEGSDTFGVPIGGADSPAAGTLVGERYSRQLLQQVIRAGALPLPINYVVTDRDDDLMKLVAIGNLPAWDALVVPAAARAGVTADPGHVAPNSSAGAPGVTPVATTTPQSSTSQTSAAVATAATAAAVSAVASAEHVETEITIGGRRYRLTLDAIS